MFNATLRNPETREDAINDPRSFLPMPDYENWHFAKRAIAPKAHRQSPLARSSDRVGRPQKL
jgi:hypothetical protein